MTKQTRKESSKQKRQYWQTEVNAWQQSGMNQTGYCRSRELKIKTFAYWLRKLRREKAEPLKFVELPAEKLLACNQVINRSTDLKLIIDDNFSIEVRDGFNRDTLKGVIETVRQL